MVLLALFDIQKVPTYLGKGGGRNTGREMAQKCTFALILAIWGIWSPPAGLRPGPAASGPDDD